MKKVCSKCGLEKDLIYFYKDKTEKDNLTRQCKDCIKKYYSNPERKIRRFEQKKRWSEKNYKKYYKDNKEKLQKNMIKYYKDHKDEINKKNTIKRKNNVSFNIKILLRNRIRKAIKIQNTIKSKHTLELLGCSLDFLKQHLQETAIKNGYNDFNINSYSSQEYHIDHIIPCASFDLTKPEEQRKCFHWSNLQILEAKYNLIKKDSY